MSLSHRDIDQRSLAFHRLAVDKIGRDPALLMRVRQTLVRWRAQATDRTAPALDEWQRLLDEHDGAPALTMALEDSDRAAQLRQSSPLACVLTAAERFDIIRQWRTTHAAA